LVDRHAAGLRRRVRRTLAGAGARVRAEQVEEVVQEVYCRLLAGEGRRLRGCRAGSERALAAYLGRMAERVALDHLRTAAAAKRGGGRLVEVGPEEVAERAADPAASPEERLLAAERRREFLRRCQVLARPGLARRDARIAVLALLDGWTCGEIAAAAGGRMTTGSVASVVHRMRQRLLAEGLAPGAAGGDGRSAPPG
jgi:RNA polymerase sigma factor (sigma-70 family)